MSAPNWQQREQARDAAIARVAPSLTPEVRERIRREVDAMPPLAQEQRDAVAVLLDGYIPDRRPIRNGGRARAAREAAEDGPPDAA